MAPLLSTFLLLLLLSFPLLTPASISRRTNKSSSKATIAVKKEPPFVGLTISDKVSSFLPPKALSNFLLSQQITHIRLSNPPLPLLAALNSTNISILLTIPNSLLFAFAASPSSASSFVARTILPFIPSISSIAVGDDFSPSISTSLLLPAIQSLSAALSNLSLRIPISTPLPFSTKRDFGYYNI